MIGVSDTALFIIGALVTLIAAGGIVPLILAAVADGREDARRRGGRPRGEETAA